MKIGVDARLLARPLTGIGRYIFSICSILADRDNVELYLYSPTALRADLPKFKYKIRTKNWRHLWAHQIWGETYLPWWARCDKIDVFWGPAHKLPLFLPAKIASVLTIHDLAWKYAANTMRPLSWIIDRVKMPLAVKKTDIIVAVSYATAAAIKQHFKLNETPIKVIYHGASSSSEVLPLSGLNQLGIPSSYFLFVGILERRKNLQRLLTAYANLSYEIKEQMILVIAGREGWGGINIEALLIKLGIKNRVKLLGYVTEPILASLYKHAQFLALPSLYEGFGLPLVEAMVYGTPSLTSNSSSMPEIIGDAGLLIDPVDTDSIQRGLTRLITAIELRRKLSDNALKRVKLFNWQDTASALLTCFKQAIAHKKSNKQK